MSDEIKIDHNVPPPVGRIRGKYPWNKMKKGDSFFAPTPFLGGIATAAAYRIGNGCKFITKTVTERGVKGKRVWRIS